MEKLGLDPANQFHDSMSSRLIAQVYDAPVKRRPLKGHQARVMPHKTPSTNCDESMWFVLVTTPCHPAMSSKQGAFPCANTMRPAPDHPDAKWIAPPDLLNMDTVYEYDVAALKQVGVLWATRVCIYLYIHVYWSNLRHGVGA